MGYLIAIIVALILSYVFGCFFDLRSRCIDSDEPLDQSQIISNLIIGTFITTGAFFKGQKPSATFWGVFCSMMIVFGGIGIWIANNISDNGTKEDVPYKIEEKSSYKTEDDVPYKMEETENTEVESVYSNSDETDLLETKSLSFAGLINDKYEIRGTLNISNGEISVQYCYESSIRKYGDTPSMYINLYGTIDEYNYVELSGTTSDGKQERWTGTLEKNDYNEFVFHGTFYGAEDKEFSIYFKSK